MAKARKNPPKKRKGKGKPTPSRQHIRAHQSPAAIFDRALREGKPSQTGSYRFDDDGTLVERAEFADASELYEFEALPGQQRIPYLESLIRDLLAHLNESAVSSAHAAEVMGEITQLLRLISRQLRSDPPDLRELGEGLLKFGALHQREIVRQVEPAVQRDAKQAKGRKAGHAARYGSREEIRREHRTMYDDWLDLINGGLLKTAAYRRVARTSGVSETTVRRAVRKFRVDD